MELAEVKRSNLRTPKNATPENNTEQNSTQDTGYTEP
jgi:hypothetical protein